MQYRDFLRARECDALAEYANGWWAFAGAKGFATAIRMARSLPRFGCYTTKWIVPTIQKESVSGRCWKARKQSVWRVAMSRKKWRACRVAPNCETCRRPLQRSPWSRAWVCPHGCGACAHCGRPVRAGERYLSCWLCPNCPHQEPASMEGIPCGQACSTLRSA
jgi:hypothetical protein